MAKMTGLGKGLDALFADNSVMGNLKSEEIQQGEVIKSIKIIDIEPNRDQPRRNFDEESIEELADSIKVYGVIQPIIVTKKDDYYQIVAGERRWRASKKAGLAEMPCIVRDYNERKNKEIALIENIQREDLNPIEKARGFKQLIDDYGLRQQDLADIMGMNRTSVSNSLRILNLDNRVIDLAIAGKLSESHCRSLLAYEGDKQYQMALKIIEYGESVRDIERKVKNDKNVLKNTKAEQKKYQAIYKDIEDRFQGFFGTKVKLDAGVKSGKIIIKYSDSADLERILELIENN